MARIGVPILIAVTIIFGHSAEKASTYALLVDRLQALPVARPSILVKNVSS